MQWKMDQRKGREGRDRTRVMMVIEKWGRGEEKGERKRRQGEGERREREEGYM